MGMEVPNQSNGSYWKKKDDDVSKGTHGKKKDDDVSNSNHGKKKDDDKSYENSGKKDDDKSDDNDVKKNDDDDDDLDDWEVVTHVKEALISASAGDTDNYEGLVSTLHIPEGGNDQADYEALLVATLKGLSGAAHYLDSNHGRLLSSILAMSMWEFENTAVMDAVVEFIVALATSSGRYVDLSLEMLVSNFTPNQTDVTRRLNFQRIEAKKQQVLSRVHGALKDIADLIPLAPCRLTDIIIRSMPNMYSKGHVLPLYVESIFRLDLSSGGELVGGSDLISAVVERLVKLDVEIGWDYILAEDFTKGIFEIELEDQQTEAESQGESSSCKGLRGSMMAENLDTVMELTFKYVKSCKDSDRLDEVFDSLLHSFEHTILPTHKPKFAQFVMFYACSLDPVGCGERFADWLAEKFFFNKEPITRMSSIAYLSTYLARSKFLATSVVARVLIRLVQWCCDHCRNQTGFMDPTDQKWFYARCQDNKLFYAACQAVLYILCFWMKSILDVPRLKSQLLLMPFQQILINPLEPLQVCLPSIVQEFVRQANAVQLLDEAAAIAFDGMLESQLSKAFGGTERLDNFFPFDPCLLKKCDSYIRPNYVRWSSVRKTYDVDEDEDDDVSIVDDDVSSDDDDDVDPGHGVPMEEFSEGGNPESFDDHDEFNSSLRNMSITPKDSFLRKFGEMSKFSMQMLED